MDTSSEPSTIATGVAAGVDRAFRLVRVVRDVVARRLAGESASDESVIAAHADLMPELEQRLHALRRVELARVEVDEAGGPSATIIVGVGERQIAATIASLGPVAAVPLTAGQRLDLSGATRTTGARDDSASATPELPAGGPPPADLIPGYELKDEIHRGGQGIVYRAVQKSTRREVAVKVTREGPFTGASDRARFEREVRILAQLDHPNIVTIFDSGVAAGHFYYVMRLIDGQPVTRWLEAHPRPLRRVLELFAAICDAVAAAHLKGIIHRDLKPGNILVDGAGTPFVLDFGLAKLAEALTTAGGGSSAPVGGAAAGGGAGVAAATDDSSAARDLTQTGQFVGSLPWAAPEQAEGRPDRIDVRTDVYALGVVLYQLLTGEFPYAVAGNIRDVLDNILRAEPLRPSALLRRRSVSGAAAAAAPTSEPAAGSASRRSAVTARLDEDIDTIALKCLAKDAARRYQGAGELARDVRHWLAGEPIEARRDSTAYVLRKIVRRHRAAVAVAGGVVLLLALATTALYLMYLSRGQALANAEWALGEAQRRERQTKQVSLFQASMLEEVVPDKLGRVLLGEFRSQVEESLQRNWLVGGAGPSRKRQPEEIAQALATFDDCTSAADMTAIARRALDLTVLKPALEALEREFATEPVIQALLRRTVAHIYRQIGMYETAEAQLQLCIAAQRALGDEGRTEALRSTLNLADLLRERGAAAAAESMYREALAALRSDDQASPVDLARAHLGLGNVARKRRDFAAAREMLERAFDLSQTGALHDERQRALVVGELAQLDHDCRDLEAAHLRYAEALERMRAAVGPDHREVATVLNNWGELYLDRGDRAGTIAMGREALRILIGLQGEDHPATATAMNNLGIALSDGKYSEEAERLCQRALEVRRVHFGDESLPVAATQIALGRLAQFRGNLSQADRLYQAALSVRRKLLGPDHALVAESSLNRAGVLMILCWDADAEPLLRDGLRICEAAEPAASKGSVSVRLKLVKVLVRLNRFDEAEELLRSLEFACEAQPPSNPDVRLWLARAYVDLYSNWLPLEPNARLDVQLGYWTVRLAEMDQGSSTSAAQRAKAPPRGE